MAHINEYVFKTEPFEHQREALSRSINKKSFAYFMEMGCVDGDTEFLSNRGWIKFKDLNLKDWKRPLLVAQVMQSSIAENRFTMALVPPTNYIEKEVDTFYHFTGRGVDMMLTPEHEMVTRYTRVVHRGTGTRKKKHYKQFVFNDQPAETVKNYVEFKQNSSTLLQRSRFQVMPMCCNYEGIIGYQEQENEVTQLSQWELRLMVAIIADGNFPNKKDNRCVMEFMKERKKERFEMLCKKAGVVFIKEKVRRDATRYQLIAPVKVKEYDHRFWVLTPRQKSFIFDEFYHWDGSTNLDKYGNVEQYRFYSSNKKSADFIQHVCSIHGFYSSLITERRKKAPNKISYVVYYYPRRNINTNDDAWLPIKEVETINSMAKAYCFRVPSGMLMLRRNDKIFVTGNSGKTKVMIDNMAALYQDKQVTGAVILAPKGVYNNWASLEIPRHMPDTVPYELLVWKAEAGKSYKRELKRAIWEPKENAFQIMVFNIESLLSKEGKDILDEFIASHQGKVFAIVDESTCIKNHKAKRTKAAIEIGAKCLVKRIATGSPITNSPLDIYSQMNFLGNKILGYGSYYAFRNTFANIEKQQTRHGMSYDKIISYKNLDLLSQLLDPWSYRITKKECIDLPEKIYITRDVPLTPEQINIYKDMRDRDVAYLNDEEMSIQVILTKLLRLHQILCGSFTSDEGEIQSIPNNRVPALLDVLNEASGKCVIWANYLKNIADIEEAITKEYGADSFVSYYGAVSPEDRQKAITLFQDPNSPVKYFIGNVQTAGRGITLTEASTVIYFSNNFSLEMRQQSEDRAHRIGQKNKVTYIDLVSRGTLDEKILKALVQKRSIANLVLNDDLDEWIAL